VLPLELLDPLELLVLDESDDVLEFFRGLGVGLTLEVVGVHWTDSALSSTILRGHFLALGTGRSPVGVVLGLTVGLLPNFQQP